jgi:hypothetical protein
LIDLAQWVFAEFGIAIGAVAGCVEMA